MLVCTSRPINFIETEFTDSHGHKRKTQPAQHGRSARKHEVCKLWPGLRGIGQECAHGDPTYIGVPASAMRENLPQFWTTPFSEASTHAKQKHWVWCPNQDRLQNTALTQP